MKNLEAPPEVDNIASTTSAEDNDAASVAPPEVDSSASTTSAVTLLLAWNPVQSWFMESGKDYEDC